jgi:AcrR family transcriptional regulator
MAKKANKKEIKQQRAKVTHDSILEAADKILHKEGMKKFTTNHVAEVAGVSIGSLYQYFRNKEKIIESLLSKEIDKNLVAFEKELYSVENRKLNEKDFIKILINVHIKNWETKGMVGKIMMQFASKVLTTERLRKVDDKLIPFLIEKAKEFELDLNFEDLDLALFICIYSVRASIFLSNTSYDHLDPDKLVDELTTMIHSYITNR